MLFNGFLIFLLDDFRLGNDDLLSSFFVIMLWLNLFLDLSDFVLMFMGLFMVLMGVLSGLMLLMGLRFLFHIYLGVCLHKHILINTLLLCLKLCNLVLNTIDLALDCINFLNELGIIFFDRCLLLLHYWRGLGLSHHQGHDW